MTIWEGRRCWWTHVKEVESDPGLGIITRLNLAAQLFKEPTVAGTRRCRMEHKGYNDDYAVFSELPSELRQKWIKYLTDAYNEPQRHYHTLTHVHSMMAQLHSIEASLQLSSKQFEVLHLAIWFHDVIYDPQTKKPGYNEIQSALDFENYARDVGLV